MSRYSCLWWLCCDFTFNTFCDHNLSGAADPDAWRKWNAAPLARTRDSITMEAGKIVGTPGYSVKRPPIATLPVRNDQPLIEAVPIDKLHAEMRLGERLIEGSIQICAQYTGDKLAKRFEEVVRTTKVHFTTFETIVRNQV